MGSKKNILPLGNTNSSNKCGIFNSRQYYKGTSFKMSGEWKDETNYFNDEYIVDFVAYKGALLSCSKSHLSSATTEPVLIKNPEGEITGIQPNEYWTFVLAGIEGPEGSVWEPSYEASTGNLTWSLVSNPSNPGTMNIRGPQGTPGKDGKDGNTPVISAKKDTNGLYYWTLNDQWLLASDGQKVLAQGLTGATGAQGQRGERGLQGNTPILKSGANGVLQVSYDEGQHWSTIGTVKGDKGDQGNQGLPGKNGITPLLRMQNNFLQVSYDGRQWTTLGNVVGAQGLKGDKGDQGKRGEDGITPVMRVQDTFWEVSYNKGESWELVGKAIGPQGVPGKSPKLQVSWGDPDNQYDDRILWGYDGIPISEWTTLCYLSDLRGDSIAEVNITDKEGALEITMTSGRRIISVGSVLPRFVAGTIETVEYDQLPQISIDKTNAPREWALDLKVPKGKPATVTVVEQVDKLSPDAQPFVTDLNPSISDANLKFGIPQGEKGDPGDQNVFIGCYTPVDTTQIWYDPCDDAMDHYSAKDFLYESYLLTTEDAGIDALSKLDFEKAFATIGINSTSVKLVFLQNENQLPDLKSLSDSEIRKLIGTLYLIPEENPSENNGYTEYTVIEGPSSGEFHWEVLGTNSVSINIDDYYTKDQTNEMLSNKVDYYNSNNIKLAHNSSLFGTLANDSVISMIHIDASNNLTVGSNSIPLQFQTSIRPVINLSSGDEKVAYLSEVESLRTEVENIKQALTVVKVTA